MDLLVVGRFGSTSGLSAVSTGSQVLNLVTFRGDAVCHGYHGSDCPLSGREEAGDGSEPLSAEPPLCSRSSLWYCFVVMVMLCATDLRTDAGPRRKLLDLTAAYVRICGSGIFFIVAYNLLSAIFRGLGDSQSPLLFRAGGLYREYHRRPDSGGWIFIWMRQERPWRRFWPRLSAWSLRCMLLIKKKLPFKITKQDFRLNLPVPKSSSRSVCRWHFRNF